MRLGQASDRPHHAGDVLGPRRRRRRRGLGERERRGQLALERPVMVGEVADAVLRDGEEPPVERLRLAAVERVEVAMDREEDVLRDVLGLDLRAQRRREARRRPEHEPWPEPFEELSPGLGGARERAREASLGGVEAHGADSSPPVFAPRGAPYVAPARSRASLARRARTTTVTAMPADARRLLHERLDRGDDPEDAANAALSASNECVEAWLVLADCATSLVEARARVRKAVEAAVKSLGEAGLREGRGRLGATPEGLAYLHALAALARHQVAEDRAEQAIQTLSGLLAMDPADPAAVRGDLLLLLLAEARDDEASDLVARYPEEANADWMFAAALLRRRRATDADSLARATEPLARAIGRFPAYARALSAPADAPPRGGAAADPVVRGGWEDTEGAFDWLRATLAASEASPQAGTPPKTGAAALDAEADKRFSAKEHAAEAWEASGARRVELARQALDLWPDCVDAWLALESAGRDAGERVRAAESAVAAGARVLHRDPAGPPVPAGDGEDARLYLRARAALAAARRDARDEEGACAEERRLVAEDPDDATGAALSIAARALATGRDADARALLERHAEDAAPGWAWARVLARRREDDRVAAAFALSEAMLVAPLVAQVLLAHGARVTGPLDEGPPDPQVHEVRVAR